MPLIITDKVPTTRFFGSVARFREARLRYCWCDKAKALLIRQGQGVTNKARTRCH